jgi:peptidoglycan hydrolase CwlO-like protein
MMVRNLVAVVAVTVVAMGLSGCDYWPPALQTQIEQLRSEVQMVTMEKAQLQNQLASITKAKDDLQAQVDDLSRASRDKSVMITSLQNSLTALQGRQAKAAKTAAPKTAAVQSTAKAKPKAPAAKQKTPAPAKGTRPR